MKIPDSCQRGAGIMDLGDKGEGINKTKVMVTKILKCIFSSSGKYVELLRN